MQRSFKLLVALALALAAAPAAQAQPSARPNIVWITVEDMSPRLGAYGDPLARTPHIDRLAAEGRRYTRAFTTAGVCAPSRAAIITGMYQTAIGAHHMRSYQEMPTHKPYWAVPPPQVKAFTEYLRAAGYYTSNNSKTDYQFAPITDERQPLTAWDASGKTAHWRGRKPGQPFFAVFNSTRTHESQVWPNPNETATTDPAQVSLPPYYPDTPTVRADIARHYDNIARMDAWVGGLLQELGEAGLLDSTIIFFYSDHGDGLPRMKRELYDSGLHVPLIVRWPGKLKPGAVDERLVSFVDLAPTVLSLAGLAPPRHMQGRAFLGPQAASAAPRDYIFAARDRMDETVDMQRAVRDARFKYIRNFRPDLPYVQELAYRNRMPMMQELTRLHAEGKLDAVQALWFAPTKPAEELYDLQADPHEVRNLAADPQHAKTLQRMRRELETWQRETNDLGRTPEPQLANQFWPNGIQPRTALPAITSRRAGAQTVVSISAPTPGASVAYTLEAGDEAHWLLYTGPVTVDGPATVRARAVRYGWAESPTATLNVQTR